MCCSHHYDILDIWEFTPGLAVSGCILCHIKINLRGLECLDQMLELSRSPSASVDEEKAHVRGIARSVNDPQLTTLSHLHQFVA